MRAALQQPRRPVASRLAIVALLLAAALPAAAQGEGADTPIDWVALCMGVLGGLALFLYGVDVLATALKQAQGGRFHRLLERSSDRRLAALATGTAATVVLDSSSVVIILLITIIDAGLLPLANALPVILGANIGTTFSSQVFAWNVDAYAPVAIAAGLASKALVRSDAAKRWSLILLALGMVLFGLNIIGDAVEPLQRQPDVLEWLKRLESPLLGVAAGALATVAIQSSSAMMGIVITLAGGGLITLPAGIAIMLGGEIGTCADTLVAATGRSRAAVKAGIFHLLFNLCSVTVGILLIDGLAAFAEVSASDTGQRIANAHILFNLAGALAVLPFTRTAARWLDRLVPDANDAGEAAAAAG